MIIQSLYLIKQKIIIILYIYTNTNLIFITYYGIYYGWVIIIIYKKRNSGEYSKLLIHNRYNLN